MSHAPAMPLCPRCGAPMRLARVWPGSFGRPELRSFACTRCREVVTLETPSLAAAAKSDTIRA